MPVALLAVSDKAGVVAFGRALREMGWRLVATAGTAAALRAEGVESVEVSALTGSPEILGGRVKTLHPALFAGLLARGPEDDADLARVGAERIDLAAVDLYPFEADPRIETIDVGGVALLRAAAKNAARVLVVSSPARYEEVLAALRAGGDLSALRARLAAETWRRVAVYDAAIAAHLGADEAFPPETALGLHRREVLRYGENPHQAAAWYRLGGAPGLHDAELLGGKPLSSNNVADLDSAAAAVRSLGPGAVVVVKHANPCGAAVRATAEEAFAAALRCDPGAAFGGIVAAGAPLDAAAAAAMAEVFLECVLAPAFDEEALALLRRKKNLRLLRWPGLADSPAGPRLRGVAGGAILEAQDESPDDVAAAAVVSKRAPTDGERRALDFAWRLVRVVKSNAVALAWPGEAAGIGGGLVSRVDSARVAAAKARDRLAREAAAPGPLVAASDAFLPFRDALDVVAEAGATALVHSGGSIRDAEVAAAADERGMALLVTGRRHFRH